MENSTRVNSPAGIPYDQNPAKCGYYGGKRTDGQPCGKTAGYGVPGETTGKCRRCRRYGGGRPPIHGRYMNADNRAHIAEAAQRFMNDPEPLNMFQEIAIVREILHRTLRKFNVDPDAPGFDPNNPPAVDLDEALKLIGAIKMLAAITESQERIRASQALTTAEALRLLMDMQEFITMMPDDQREKFTAWIHSRYGKAGLPVEDVQLPAVEVESDDAED